MEKPTSTINLESFKARIQLEETRLANARSGVTDAERNLADAYACEHSLIRLTIIMGGETTGDELKDMLLCQYGFARMKDIDKIVLFNEQLKHAKDKYLLLYAKRHAPSGLMHENIAPPHEEELSEIVEHHFVLGRLTGASLVAHFNVGSDQYGTPTISLPFSGYVSWKSDEPQMTKQSGSYILTGDVLIAFSGALQAADLIERIVASDANALEACKLRYHIGDVDGINSGSIDEDIGNRAVFVGLDNARKMLDE